MILYESRYAIKTQSKYTYLTRSAGKVSEYTPIGFGFTSDWMKTSGVSFLSQSCSVVVGAVASWLVRSTPERAVGVRALASDVVLCSWARHYSHGASLHPGV